MESFDIIQELKNVIKELIEINGIPSTNSKDINLKKEENELIIIKKIVNYFNKILADNFILIENKSPKSPKKFSYFFDFICKHFNNPLVRFCLIYNNKDEKSFQKGELWIFLSILENSFSESVKEIYSREWDKKYYKQNSILIMNHNEIMNILNDLEEIEINIKTKEYKIYLEYLKKNADFIDKDIDNFYLNIEETAISIKDVVSENSKFSEKSIASMLEKIDFKDETNKDIDNNRDYVYEKNSDFAPKIINNFYNFNVNPQSVKLNTVLSKYNEEESSSSKLSLDEEEEVKVNQGLVLNPIKPIFLPTDKLYEIPGKNIVLDFNKLDKIIYKNRLRPISNCLLLYLNKYYKKAPYHKFFKHNLYNRAISLEMQNYQCYICYKRFKHLLDLPMEPVTWCSYYMRYVCSNCIDGEYSIIPYFVLEKWCFKKFPISKKAKNILLEWYTKPVIYLKKYDNLLKKLPHLNKVIEIKRVINIIFDKMKCKNKFIVLEEKLGEYEYLALKEYIFSMRDLVEINSKIFYKKINEFKNKLVGHISGECQECKFEGERCGKCGSSQKIFFYDIENVLYCKICRKSFHKKCIGLVGHVH